MPQLADLLDEDVPVADVHQFNALWQRAVARAAETHRHLLLMVDGLDEDTGPPRVPSVAMLLPLITGSCGHVLVAGRRHPELPVDVPVEHPLPALPPTALQPFAGHEKLKELAHQEIHDLLHRDDDGLASDVLGVLAAAGPLSVSDLTVLWRAATARSARSPDSCPAGTGASPAPHQGQLAKAGRRRGLG